MRHVEDTLQKSCVAWWDWTHPRLSHLLFHVPNGGKRNLKEATKFKAMGVRPGVSDLILLVPSRTYHFICYELKIGKNTQTDNQRAFQALVTQQGGKYVVVRSLDQFIEETNQYLAS